MISIFSVEIFFTCVIAPNIIDFGCLALGDPACDLVIAWTFLNGKARDIFVQEMDLDEDTWLRAKA